LATSGKMRRKEKPKEKKAVAARGEGGWGRRRRRQEGEGESERVLWPSSPQIFTLRPQQWEQYRLPGNRSVHGAEFYLQPPSSFHSSHPLRSGSLPASPFPCSLAANSTLPSFPSLPSPLLVTVSLGPIFHPRTSLAEGQRREVIDIVAMPRVEDAQKGAGRKKGRRERRKRTQDFIENKND